MDLINTLLNVGNKIIDRLFPDPIERTKAQLELLKLQQNGELAQIVEQSKVVIAEIQSESWLVRNWRPMIMVLFGIIMLNNYIIIPWLKTFGLPIAIMDIPPNMWSLLEIGMGGYVVGRSFEKSIKAWKE